MGLSQSNDRDGNGNSNGTLGWQQERRPRKHRSRCAAITRRRTNGSIATAASVCGRLRSGPPTAGAPPLGGYRRGPREGLSQGESVGGNFFVPEPGLRPDRDGAKDPARTRKCSQHQHQHCRCHYYHLRNGIRVGAFDGALSGSSSIVNHDCCFTIAAHRFL